MIPKNLTKPAEPEVIRSTKNVSNRSVSPHVAALIFKNLKKVTPMWWAEINALLVSRNVLDRKFAIDQINKLQLKAMPTELIGGDGTDIKIAVINYGDPDSVQLQAKTIPSAAPKRHRQRNPKSG